MQHLIIEGGVTLKFSTGEMYSENGSLVQNVDSSETKAKTTIILAQDAGTGQMVPKQGKDSCQ